MTQLDNQGKKSHQLWDYTCLLDNRLEPMSQEGTELQQDKYILLLR